MKPTKPVINSERVQTEDMLTRILNIVEASDKVLKEMSFDFSQLSQMVMSHSSQAIT